MLLPLLMIMMIIVGVRDGAGEDYDDDDDRHDDGENIDGCARPRQEFYGKEQQNAASLVQD